MDFDIKCVEITYINGWYKDKDRSDKDYKYVNRTILYEDTERGSKKIHMLNSSMSVLK